MLDLLSDYDWIEEKIESLAVTEQGYWFASDNDGGINSTRMGGWGGEMQNFEVGV
ncbi:MAG: LarC family nickel insertion protein [Leptolyngbyaceae cyanobacterium SL_5_9]|nr:LarC family nickel insertion protein [Leptolyngbyaceae cyanobacterium SL_5_9]